jgi:hypothetical protein
MADPTTIMNNAARNVPSGTVSYGDASSREGNPGTLDIFKYPSNLGSDSSESKNFVLFYAKPGGPGNRTNLGLSSKSSLTALYIPPNALRTNFEGKYEEFRGGRVFEQGLTDMAVTFGPAAAASVITKHPLITGISAVLGAVGSAVYKGVSDGNLSTGMIVEQTMNTISNSAQGFGTLVAGSAGSSGMLNPLQAGLGFAINPHSSLLYKGPGAFRVHDFSFDFWPRSYIEAESVSKLIQNFKSKMLPKMNDFMKLKSVYFGFPHEFYIDFYIGSGEGSVKQFKQMGIKRSVLTKMNMNFDGPQGPSFYDPPTSGKEPMPVHTKLDMSFQETEFILEYNNTTSDNFAIKDDFKVRGEKIIAKRDKELNDDGKHNN